VVGVPFAGLEGDPVGAAGHRGAGGEQGRDAALGIGDAFAERGPLVAIRGCGKGRGKGMAARPAPKAAPPATVSFCRFRSRRGERRGTPRRSRVPRDLERIGADLPALSRLLSPG
jgi:hypothetical protein